MQYSYELKRSKRKSISLEISRDASLIVRAPIKMSVKDIEAFLSSKHDWIDRNLDEVKKRCAMTPERLEEKQLAELEKIARKYIPERVSYFANIMGVEYGRIAIRKQKTRFGSCSAKKNLNFNLAIMLMPQRISDYVIVHELSHLIEMNHSARFWSEVEKVMPDYKDTRRWLRENGVMYIQMI